MNLSNADKIIAVTTELIEKNDGDVQKITARVIAEKAGVALGLINYYFGSKQSLITLCVQKIISQVVHDFSMSKSFDTTQERLEAAAIDVFDFLFEHPSISKISILNDLDSYGTDNNSSYAQKGFYATLAAEYAEGDSKLLSFILISAMQIAFLSRNLSKEVTGYDFNIKPQRHLFIKKIVATILDGQGEEYE